MLLGGGEGVTCVFVDETLSGFVPKNATRKLPEFGVPQSGDVNLYG